MSVSGKNEEAEEQGHIQMSGKGKTLGAENRKDWFGAALIGSILLHCLIIVFLPSTVSKDTESLIVRSMTFIRKDIVDPIRAPATPETARLDPDSRASLKRVTQSETIQVASAPAVITIRESAAQEEKLKLMDKIERRPGGKSDTPPRFPDIIRNLISASCDRNVPNNVRTMGGRLEKLVVLSVIILPSGKLELVDIVQSSNLPAVDLASIKAVKLAAPFPKFPTGLGLSKLKLNVRIRFALGGKTG